MLRGSLLIACLLGVSCDLTSERERCGLAVHMLEGPLHTYGPYKILGIVIRWNGPCDPDAFVLAWWNDTTGSAGTGEVRDLAGCFPGFGCSVCDLQGHIWELESANSETPLAMGENHVTVEVTDVHGHVARDSVVIIRHE